MNKVVSIHAEWDAEAEVWVATSDDVPGLATEAETIEVLSTEAETIEVLSTKLETMVPELLDANGHLDGPEVPFELLARRFSVIHRAALIIAPATLTAHSESPAVSS